jgi:ankyrin repeat protein
MYLPYFGAQRALKNLYRELDEASRNGEAQRVQTLLQQGAHPDGHVRFSRPPLAPAIRSGNIEAVRRLLAYGANVNICTAYFCPLIWAIQKGSEIRQYYKEAPRCQSVSSRSILSAL